MIQHLQPLAVALADDKWHPLPTPPLDSVIRTELGQWLFLGANTTIFVVGIVYAAFHSRRAGTLIPLMCLLGGAACIYTEAIVDSHLQVWWPIHTQPDVWHAFGRSIPIMVIPIVGWYFGLGTYLRWAFLQKLGARLPVWKVYLAEVGAAILLEPPAIQLHLWHYYGEQGIRLFGYPIWWPFIGGACGVLAGTVVYKLTPYLTGWRVLLVPVLIPMSTMAVYWAAGGPMFNALNMEPAQTWISYAAAAVSVAFAFLIVWVCTIATGHHEHRQQEKAARHAADPELATAGARA
ncbi:MAG: hypothetical protein J2P57_01535 [Acidimicrobiaceae bacterium]|nr:hypothetical protein [Acidimicrobiaceae bacterium]